MSGRRTRSKAAAPEPFVAAIIRTDTHIVTRDGKPCTLINVSGLHKGGVLIPGTPVIAFPQVRDARRAIKRTETARGKLRDSLVSEWLRQQIPSFIDGGGFAVVPVGHQVEPHQALAESEAAG